MSYLFEITLTCDGCLKEIKTTEFRKTKVQNATWSVEIEAEKKGWISLNRGYRPDTHHCKECSDKPITPLKKREKTND